MQDIANDKDNMNNGGVSKSQIMMVLQGTWTNPRQAMENTNPQNQNPNPQNQNTSSQSETAQCDNAQSKGATSSAQNSNDTYSNNAQNNKNVNSQTEQFKKAVDIFADASNHILSTVGWVAEQLNAPGNVFRLSDAVGQTAEITLSIPTGGTGELVVLLGKTRKYYAAKCKDSLLEIKRGSKVKIVDIAVNTMFVEPVQT